VARPNENPQVAPETTDRKTLAEGATEFVSGRDPDNLPLLSVCYRSNDPVDMDYYPWFRI
jgi:hypothetical protein